LGSSVNPPAIAVDGTLYVMARIFPFPNPRNGLYAINPDGTLKWHFPADISGNSPAIGPDGTIYITEDFDNLYAVNPDGTLNSTLAN
jgi:outer membrane protein assembly factor BamB